MKLEILEQIIEPVVGCLLMWLISVVCYHVQDGYDSRGFVITLSIIYGAVFTILIMYFLHPCLMEIMGIPW